MKCFKVGDKVRCVVERTSVYDCIGEVTGIIDVDMPQILVDFKGTDWRWHMYPHELELVK